jgi:hypothetical protein
MPLSDHPLWRVLQIDELNREQLARLLEAEGLLPSYDQVPRLFEALPSAVQARNQGSGRNPFVRQAPDGSSIRTWDFALRIFMAQSAHAQFLQAASHLLRGHSLEIFGHARTMIENSGVAFLSSAEPDLADAYLETSRRAEYKDRTGSGKILPKNDPRTADLNEAFGVASRTFHSNFVSIAGRMESEFAETPADKVSFVSTMKYHDVDARDPRQFLMHACWLIGVTGLVLRLFAVAFGIEDTEWAKRVADLQAQVRDACGALHPRLFGGADDAKSLGA